MEFSLKKAFKKENLAVTIPTILIGGLGAALFKASPSIETLFAATAMTYFPTMIKNIKMATDDLQANREQYAEKCKESPGPSFIPGSDNKVEDSHHFDGYRIG